MKYLLDTCVFSDIQQIDLPLGDYAISDITVFETFKNSTLIESIQKFEVFKKRLLDHGIGMIAKKKRYLKIFEINSLSIKRLNEIGIDVSLHMFQNYLNFIKAILMTIIASKNKFEIINDCIKVNSKSEEMNAKFINVISRSVSKLWNKGGYIISKSIYKQRDNFNEMKAETIFINISLKHYNDIAKNTPFSLNEAKHFNYDELVKKNNVHCTKEMLNQYIDVFIKNKKGSPFTKQIYLAYAYELIICGGKIEYNDIIDMNLLSAALSKNMVLITKENKIKRVMKNYEKAYKQSDNISNMIKIIE